MSQPGASTDTPAEAPEAPAATPEGAGEAPGVETPEVATAGTDAPDSPVDFRLADVPPEYRDHVERYIQSQRPAMTRAFQEAATARAEAEQAAAFVEALNSPDTAYEVLREQLDHYGIELDRETWEAAQAADGSDPDSPSLEASSPELQYLLERERAREAAEAEQAQQQESQMLRNSLTSHLDALAEARNYGEGADAVPEPVSNGVAAFAAVLPNGQDGLPNLRAAQEMVEAIEAHAVERFIARKQPDTPPAGGGPGERRVDPRSTPDRLALANDIAQRAMARHTT